MAFVSRHAPRFARWVALSAFALLAGTSTAGLAAPPPGKIEPKATARSQADLGYELFEAGHYVEAAQAFRIAEGLFHAPTLVFAIGRAESKTGHLLEAREMFRKVIAEKIAPTAPREFVGAQESARTELAAVEARIPHVVITVNGAAGRSFGVRLDDAAIERSALGEPIDVDPGAHRVVVTLDAGTEEKRTLTVAEGARETVTIDLPAAPGKAVAPVRAPVVAPQRRDLLVPALAALGVGAVGIVIGGALGGVTLAKTSAIRKHCDGDVCPRDQQNAASSARTTATISTVGFIAGGVFAATGVTLLLLRPKPQKPSIGLAFGPTSLVAQGTF